MMNSLLYLIMVLLMPTSVVALLGNLNDPNFWDDLSNNFASDLAPLISLFGEQVTVQFISESTTVLDSILFAMAPLGILTAVVSVIRACGTPLLKSVIGRAREPDGTTRVELSSSTADDICELWSSEGICRVFGHPKILEIMCRNPAPQDFYPSVTTHGDEVEVLPTCGIDFAKKVLGPLRSTKSRESETSTITDEDSSRGFGEWEEVRQGDAIWVPFPKIPYFVKQMRYFAKRKRSLVLPRIKTILLTTRSLASRIGGLRFGRTKNDRDDEEHNSKPTLKKDGKPTLKEDDKPTLEDDGEQSHVDFAPYPNLVLNIQTLPMATSLLQLWLASIFSVLLQASFFAYASWATFYHQDFHEDGTYQLPFFIVCISGTVCLVVGMALSATIIDNNSTERRFIDKGNGFSTRMFWLQPGGQHVGDQLFYTFVYSEKKKEYVTSYKNDSNPRHLIWPAILLSILGWGAQFIGSRGLHPSVALYQFGCTIIVSIIRATLRSNRFTQHESPIPPHYYREGYELHWLAGVIGDMENLDVPQNSKEMSWSITEAHDVSSSSNSNTIRLNRNILDLLVPEGSNSEVRFQEGGLGVKLERLSGEKESKFTEMCHDIMRIIERNEHQRPSIALPNDAAQLMRIRSRLAYLTTSPTPELDTVWGADIRSTARKLKSAMEKSAEYIFTHTMSSSELTPDAIIWSATCRCRKSTMPSEQDQLISFSMFKKTQGWEIDVNHLEAVLSLWYWTTSLQKEVLRDGALKAKRKLHAKVFNKKSMVFEADKMDYFTSMLQYWIPSSSYETTTNIKANGCSILSIPITSMLLESSAEVVNASSSDQSSAKVGDFTMVSTDATSSVLQLMAQDIFTIFIDRVTSPNGEVLDEVQLRRRRSNTTSEVSGLTNRHLDSLIDILVSEQVAARLEAVMTVIPSLLVRGKLSRVNYLIHDQIFKAQSLRRQMQFRESEKIIEELLDLNISGLHGRLLSSLCELYRSESHWMFRQQSFTNWEVANRHADMKRSLQAVGSQTLPDLPRHYAMKAGYSKWLDSQLGSIQSNSNSQKGPDLGKDELKSPSLVDGILNTEMVQDALSLDKKHQITALTVTIRRQILRWAIQSGLPGLVEEIWTIEKEHNLESAFINGSDEVFWAINSVVDIGDFDHRRRALKRLLFNLTRRFVSSNVERSVTLDIAQFLINVAKVDLRRPLNCPPESNQPGEAGPKAAAVAEAWEGSDRKQHIFSRYQRFGSVLSSAAAMPESLDIVRLLVEQGKLTVNDVLESGYHGNAIAAALWGGSTDTVRYLIEIFTRRKTKAILCEYDELEELDVTLKVGDFGNVLIAAAYWGRKDCVSLIIDAEQKISRWMARERFRLRLPSPSHDVMAVTRDFVIKTVEYGKFKTALEAATANFDLADRKWADERFTHDKTGVVQLLKMWEAVAKMGGGTAMFQY